MSATLLLIETCLSLVLAVPQSAIDRAYQEATALVAPSVVRIDTVGGKDQLQPGLPTAGATTGLIVSADGYLVSSAFHFVSQPTSIIVTLADGRRLAGTIVATDRQRMVTLLKVAAEGLLVPTAAPRDSFRVGQWAIALGRTFDAETPSVSVGIISALNRVWGKAVQTDAKISPVNYGGPLVDIDGRVIGILVPLSPHETGDTAGVEWYDSGIGFAVPFVDILGVVDRLKSGQDILPGLVGVTFRSKDLLQGEPIVDHVRFGSPGQIGGLKSGDRIVQMDGQPVTRIADFRQILGQKAAGEHVICELLRDGKPLTVDLELVGELLAYTPPFLGVLPLRDPAAKSVAIHAIWPDSPAAAAKLQAGDRITQIDSQDVAGPAELSEKVRQLRPGSEITLGVTRDDRQATIKVTLSLPPTSIPAELPSQPMLGTTERDEKLEVGRVSATLAGHDRDYWMFVPENYRPDQTYALVVVLHPTLAPQEQVILTGWRSECERRGIILLAPQCTEAAGWSPNDLEFLNDCTAFVRGRYNVDENRVAVVGMASSAPVAALWAFRDAKLAHGLVLIDSAPLGKVPENSPERKLSLYSLARGRTLEAAKWNQSLEDLRKAGYPAILQTTEDGSNTYPDSEQNAEIARWMEALDAI